jgi:hypothetical protein
MYMRKSRRVRDDGVCCKLPARLYVGAKGGPVEPAQHVGRHALLFAYIAIFDGIEAREEAGI